MRISQLLACCTVALLVSACGDDTASDGTEDGETSEPECTVGDRCPGEGVECSDDTPEECDTDAQADGLVEECAIDNIIVYCPGA
jgi:hypothetical protein